MTRFGSAGHRKKLGENAAKGRAARAKFPHVILAVRMSAQLRDRLARRAGACGVSSSEYVRVVIIAALEKSDGPSPV